MKPLLLAAVIGGAPASAAAVRARVIGWDIGFRPPDAAAWTERLLEELDAALSAEAEVVVFPELIGWGLAPYFSGPQKLEDISAYWNRRVLEGAAARLKDRDVLVALGSYPHKEPGTDHIVNRASVWSQGRWHSVDKLRPTPGELDEKPPTRPGRTLSTFPFRGAAAAVLICYSVEMPDLAQALKEKGVRLLLVPSATSGREGLARVRRSASARAVELGAAVLVASLTGEQAGWKNLGAPALYLPAQKGVDRPVQEEKARTRGFARKDFTLPWDLLRRLHEDRASRETRPFLD